MENGELQVAIGRRRPYRSWLRRAAPTPPRSTAERMRARAQMQNPENVVDPNLRNDQQILNAEAGDPVAPTVNNNEVDHEDSNRSENDEESIHSLDSMDMDSAMDVASKSGSSVNSSDSEASGSSEVMQSSDNESGNDMENEENNVFCFEPTKLQNLEEPIYPNVNCSKFEALLMVLSFSLRHGLTQVATEDLCQLINNIFRGEFIPSSKYMFKKIFGTSSYSFHFYCKKCESYLGFRNSLEKRVGHFVCDVCDEQCNVSNMNDGHFFITFPLREQLQFLLENTDDIMNLLEYRWERQTDADTISDIFDGKVYCKLSEEGNFLSSHYNLSLTFNTDGAQDFDSAKNSLWPVFFCINELPPSVRFNFSNSMVGGIWFGKSEPNMPLFLSQFVKEVEDLYHHGFVWRSPDGTAIKSKAILLNCVADSKAKPLIQCVKMHNGYYGCGYCNHPGVMFDNNNHQAKYPIIPDLILLHDNSFSYTGDAVDPITKLEKRFSVEDRNNTQIRTDMETAEQLRNNQGEGDICGVKGKSVLWSLFFFDLVFGFVIDYLHCVLLGVVRHVTCLWLDTTSHGQFYYIGLRIQEVENKLLKIIPPLHISRRPRPLSERCHWKGNEWRSWLLYYSTPCLQGILPSRYLKHHCLLVSAIHILLQERITKQDLEEATCFLGAFVAEFPSLYSKSLVYFNVHLLLHLGKVVELWGPLFCYSAFSFESANGQLVKLVKGSRGVLSQIAEKYSKCKTIPKLLKMYHVSQPTLSFCEDLMCYRSTQNVIKFNEVTILGPLKCFQFKDGEELALRLSGHTVTNCSYERMIIRNKMYHARCYRRKGEKSDISVIRLKGGSYGVIERIIDPENYRGEDDAQSKILLLIREVNIVNREAVVQHPLGARASHIKPCSLLVFGDPSLITTDDVDGIAILMDLWRKNLHC